MKLTAVSEDNPIIVITGPTASGKTAFSIRLAKRINGEIISADSRQIYRFLKVGTAQPTAHQRRTIGHHLIDFCEPNVVFNAGRFVSLAEKAILHIKKAHKQPILVGGTGMYIKALIDGLAPLPGRNEQLRASFRDIIRRTGLPELYARLLKSDPETARNLDPHNPARVIRALEVFTMTGKGLAYHHTKTTGSNHSYIMFGLDVPRDELRKRIAVRTERMLARGMIAETRHLLKKGFSPECPALLSLGYRHIVRYLHHEIDRKKLSELITNDTRRYAKRQKTWFKKDNRIVSLKQPFSIKTVENVLKIYVAHKSIM